ncbi:MAG: hypothetical protein U0840_29145 [Gemmataceae bacterium]
MKPIRLAVILVLIGVSSARLRAAEVDPLLPPDTESYLSVNVRQIVDSQLFQKQLLAPAKEMLLEVGGDTVRTVLKDLGVDPFKNIDRLTIVSPKTTEADRGLIIVQGTFEADKFRTKGEEAARLNPDSLKLHTANLGGSKQTLWEVVIPNQEASVFVGMPSNRTLLLSPGKDYVIDALKMHANRKPAPLKNKEFAALLERLDPKQSISVAVLGRSLGRADQELVPKFLVNALGGVEAIGGGLTVENDVRLDLLLASRDTEAAGRMHKALDKLLKGTLVGVALLGEERRELTLVLEVLKSVKVSNRGKVVGVSGKLTQDVLEDFFKKDG